MDHLVLTKRKKTESTVLINLHFHDHLWGRSFHWQKHSSVPLLNEMTLTPIARRKWISLKLKMKGTSEKQRSTITFYSFDRANFKLCFHKLQFLLIADTNFPYSSYKGEKSSLALKFINSTKQKVFFQLHFALLFFSLH